MEQEEALREFLVTQCGGMIKNPTRSNVRRLVVLAQAIKDLDNCLEMEEGEKRIAERRSNRF